MNSLIIFNHIVSVWLNGNFKFDIGMMILLLGMYYYNINFRLSIVIALISFPIIIGGICLSLMPFIIIDKITILIEDIFTFEKYCISIHEMNVHKHIHIWKFIYNICIYFEMFILFSSWGILIIDTIDVVRMYIVSSIQFNFTYIYVLIIYILILLFCFLYYIPMLENIYNKITRKICFIN